MHIFGQIFGHFLGQRGHQNALAFLGQFMAFGDEIIDLGGGRTNFASRVNQAGRANDLLDKNPARALHFPRARRGGYMHGLRPHNIPFLKFHRPIINARRQSEAKFGQCRFAPEVTAKHAADLRNGDMAFIRENQCIIGQIFKQCGRRLARFAARQIARIVFNSGARAGRLQHFQIEIGPLFQPLRFQ
ncbi:MAG: Uncharacterised protein [Alphaproteobacteria bacterium]|nr:MAG: Uncharacterised protein [Alphaproteobacteria bacterium]